jgi:hypothetical protein
MNLTTYSLSAIRTPSATYLDSFYEYKQSPTVYEQGFTFNEIDALNGAYDSSINNYTTQYLTGYKKLEDFIIPAKKDSILRNITTPLILNNLTDTSVPKVITLNSQLDNSTYLTILTSVDFNSNGSFFELDIFSDKYLRILHNTGTGYYILSARSASDVKFGTSVSTLTSNYEQQGDIFRYLLDSSGYLQIYKYYTDGLYILTLSGTNLVLTNAINNVGDRSNTLFKVYYNFESIEPKLRTSWVSYNPNKVSTLSINNEKSGVDKSNQYLLHTNYNEIDDTFTLNHLALNNARSEKGFIKRGTSLVTGSTYLPDTIFREYTTLRTGNDQEKGDDHISLTYVWYDKDIQVKNGTDTYFTTPSSIYPYEKLNINDSKFTQNGSIASTSPVLADKVRCLRTTTKTFQNGRYLCTWLSGGSVNSPGLWVDRYYYPDRISKNNALSSLSVYTPSFYDPIDSLSYPSRATSSYIFDKKSDLTIEPNTKYVYSRIGESDIQTTISTLSPIISNFTQYYSIKNVVIPYDSNSLTYDGQKYSRYDIKDSVNCTSQFTISFDFYVDPSSNYGYSIANSNREFSILNDKKITPFITLYQGNVIYIYNTDFNLIKTVSFDTDVKEVILTDPIDDFFVVCNNGLLYKVNSLGNKLKLETIPIVEYRNYTQDDTYLYFLLNLTGRTLRIHKNTFNSSYVTAVPLSLYTNDLTQSIIRSILIYDGILYGTPGENLKLKSTSEIYYLINNKQLWHYNFNTNNAKVLFDTRTAINDFEITPNDQLIIVTDDNYYQYTTNRNFVLSGTTLAGYRNIHIDTIREYTSNGLVESTALLMLSGTGPLSAINTGNLYSTRIGSASTTSLGISGRYIPDVAQVRKKYTLTNYNRLKTLNDNSLSFNLTLTNYLSSEDIVVRNIPVNLSEIDRGYHTFTYRFDAVQGNISLFIDGILYNNLTVDPAKYSIQQILKEDIYIGAVGITNGVDLATYTNQPGYYYINSIHPIKNLYIYDKALKTDEIFALSLSDKVVNDLVLSIPSGQRNNYEEIERYFRYSPITSSKSINIYVKNTNITNKTLVANIKNNILDQVTSVLPVGVKINDIKFIDFNDSVQ